MINSQIPDRVSFLFSDCRTAIVIRAIYEYGGFTRLDLPLFLLFVPGIFAIMSSFISDIPSVVKLSFN